ncbi:Frizzled-7 [Porites harrisoni]
MKKTADKTVKPKTEKRVMLMAVVLMAAAVVVLIIGMVWMQGETRSLLNTLKNFKALQESQDKANTSYSLAGRQNTRGVVIRGKRVRLSRSQPGAHRCEPITISFCQNMPYTTTQFPNFLKHRSQDDAKLAIKRKFDRLLKSKCSPDLAPFLCSILAPPCNGTQKPVSPCKELCKRAMKSCRKELQRFGINLGSAMKCRNHPKEATSQCFNGSWPKNTTATGCQPIMLTQCMAHNKTLQTGHAQMPNYFGHVTEQAVRASFNRFNDIFLIAPKECSSMLARFLCPMYAPSCADSKTLLPPCREFCVQTRSQCKRFINQAHRQNSFQWPTDLKCKNFPRKDEASCYMGPSTEVAISRPPPVPGKCQVLTIPLCQKLPYNMTMFPNLVHHKTQGEAALEVHQFYPLVLTNCSSYLTLFLCSLYAPICTILNRPLPPCRGLCNRVKNGCLPLLQKFGFSWPESMACKKFPERNGLGICVDLATIAAVTTQPPRPTDAKDRCERIADATCSAQQYKMTRMPNFFKHKSQSEASGELSKFLPVIQTNCSSELNFFLCSLYIPRCRAYKTLPCKELCVRVRKSCRVQFREIGFKFPVSCSKLPRKDESSQCIDGSRPTQMAKTTPSSAVSNTGRCEALVIPLCSGLQQNMTLFPNILNHRTQEEAALEVHQFFPLVKVGCSPYLAQFLCSVYAPPCEEPRQPCRELCNQAREGCEALMQRFGFTWPGILACNKFPTRHNGTNCIG